MNPDDPIPAPATTDRPRPSRRRLWAFRLLAIALGLSVFVVLELVCVLFDWGRPTEYDDPLVGFGAVHPLFMLDESGEAYEIAPSRREFFAAESFPAEKGPRTFRIFCLGGSTVQGRPYSIETSFTTWLELALEAADDSREWEVVNCGGISYASYRLVPILEECLRYEPDLLIVCTGHNEFLEDRTYDDIKHAPPILAVPQRFAGRFRSFVLLREGVRRLAGGADRPATEDRPVLTDEVEAILDFENGLAAYHRDDDWQAGVAVHFESELHRMAGLAEGAQVPLLLVLPPSNLGDSPPFKSEHRADASPEELRKWRRLVEAAQENYRGNLPQAIDTLEQALEIDDRYAATWYELGQCLLAVGRFEEARSAFVRARDEDICPLRITTPLEAALRHVADETGVPLVDAHELLEGECPHGILDETLLVDHVHPSFEGHKRIAERLVEEMARQGGVEPRAGWRERARAAFGTHFESLPDIYFFRGRRTLEVVRRWTQGRAEGPPAETRFPARFADGARGVPDGANSRSAHEKNR